MNVSNKEMKGLYSEHRCTHIDSTVNTVLSLLPYLSASIKSVHGVIGLLLWFVREKTTDPRWSRLCQSPWDYYTRLNDRPTVVSTFPATQPLMSQSEILWSFPSGDLSLGPPPPKEADRSDTRTPYTEGALAGNRPFLSFANSFLVPPSFCL